MTKTTTLAALVALIVSASTTATFAQNVGQTLNRRTTPSSQPKGKPLNGGSLNRPGQSPQPQPSPGGFQPQPTPGGFRPQPSPGGFQPQPTPGGFRPQPTPGGFQPQPTPGGFQPQPTLVVSSRNRLLAASNHGRPILERIRAVWGTCRPSRSTSGRAATWAAPSTRRP